MTDFHHKTSVSWVPAISGTGLCIGAIGLLTADALSTGHLTITHLMQPLLVLGTVASACWVHRCGWRRPVSALAFLLLALLGSLATIYGTLGRQADARDAKVSTAMAENRQLSNKDADLTTAREAVKVECKSGFGTKCTNATQRVDKLVADMASLRATSLDPRADAIADLLHLVANVEKKHTKAIVGAIDPLVLPLFLELGSILFFAAAFPTRRLQSAIVTLPSTQSKSETIAQPLHPLNQLELAKLWQVHPSTVSRRLRKLEAVGQVQRLREGKNMLALPAPK